MDAKLWFIRLEGWPVFLATVAVVVVFMVVLSVLMTWISKRSVMQNAIVAAIAAGVVGFGLIGLFAVLSRW